ncbi:MAG: mechanosensitive ion channel family protein [Anaerolineales bacterium]|nr:mechanosensitive ion channel family protein [Anaerolineales bacterium]
MVTIFIWELGELPPTLQWLAPWLSLLAEMAVWVAAALLLRALLGRVVRRLTRHTASDIDDVIMDASSTPLVVLVLLLGLHAAAQRAGGLLAAMRLTQQGLALVSIGVVTWWVWRLFTQVVIYYARELVERTESNLDDVLLPIANQVGPIVIVTGGLLVALQYLGVRLESLLVAIGGASFILAFALQDILSNIFSGLSLVVDTPFAYRDLVVLADGTLCEVRRIGLRVTELYNVNSHSIIYVPNSQLANERLVNMTRPSPDLIDTLEISLGTDTNLDEAKELLRSVAFGHPDVLGDLTSKLAHIDAFECLESGALKRQNGRERLTLERTLDLKLNGILERLDRLVARTRRLEVGGLSDAERRQLLAELEPLLAEFGVSVAPAAGRQRRRPAVEYNNDPASLLGLVREWITIWACDPDLGGDENTRLDIAAMWDEPIDEPLNDHQLLVRQWNRRSRRLVARLNEIYHAFYDPEGREQRLDDRLLALVAWLRLHFKEPAVAWKDPDINFLGPDDRGMRFAIELFIDDIELEHFERQERVRRELTMELVRRLRAAEVEMPFAQQTITLRRATPRAASRRPGPATTD